MQLLYSVCGPDRFKKWELSVFFEDFDISAILSGINEIC